MTLPIDTRVLPVTEASPALFNRNHTGVCADLAPALTALSAQEPIGAYLIHVYQFRELDPDRETDAWFAYESQWGNCVFPPRIRLFDPPIVSRYKDARILGRRDLKMASILRIMAIDLSPGAVRVADRVSRDDLNRALADPKQDALANSVKELLGNAASLSEDEYDRLPGALLSRFRAGESAGSFRIVFNVTTPGGHTLKIEASDPAFKLVAKEQNVWLTPHAIAFQRLKYQWDVTKVTPEPVLNLQMALAQAVPATSAGAPEEMVFAVELRPYIIGGIRSESIDEVPSTVKTSGALVDPVKDKPFSLGSKTFDNEGKYGWNVNVAIPLKGVDSVTYDGAAGLAPKKFDNKTAYFTFVRYISNVDTKRSRFRLIPGIFGGPGVSGRIGDRWLTGVSIGIWIAEPFFGVSALRRDLPVGDGTTSTRSDWLWKGTWGVSVPIRGFLASSAKK